MRTKIAVIVGLCLLLALLLSFLLNKDAIHNANPSSGRVSVTEGSVTLDIGSATQSIKAGENLLVTSDGVQAEKTPPKNPDISSVQNEENASAGSLIASSTDATDQNAIDLPNYWVVGYVFTQEGSPIPDSTVNAIEFGKDWEDATSTQTDAQGYYALQLPKMGGYALQSIPSTAHQTAIASINIVENATTATKNFFHPSATLTLRGKVIDKETEEPIAGAKVTVHSNRSYEVVYTHDDGRFSVPRQVVSESFIGTSAKGYVPNTSLDSEYPDRIKIDEQSVKEEIVIPMKPGRAATVRVFDEQDRPVTDAQVQIIVGARITYSIKNQTDAKGECLFDGLPNEKAIARVSKKTYSEAYSAIFTPGKKDSPALVEVTLGEESSISGKVANQNGEPIADRNLRIRSLRAQQILATIEGNPSTESSTDSQGGYTASGLSEGTYEIIVYGEDGMNEIAKKEVTLQAGERRTGVDIVVEEGTDRIDGLVVDKSGQPVARANVSVWLMKHSLSSGLSEIFRDTQTDSQGRFVADRVKRDHRLIVTVNAKGYQSYKYDGDFVKTITVTLKQGEAVTGTVVDRSTKSPIEGASVQLVGSITDPMKTTSDAEGRFRFSPVGDGFYMLVGDAEGYAQSTGPRFNFESGEEAKDLILELDPGNSFTGILVDTNGVPIPKASIGLMSKMDNPNRNLFGIHKTAKTPQEAASGSDGRFTLETLPPDGDVLQILHERFAPKEFRVSPEIMNGDPIPITLTPGGTIEGIVLKDGKPKSGTHIQIFNYPENTYSNDAATDENGAYRFERLPAIPFTVLKYGERAAVDGDRKQVTVREGETVRADFGTGEGASVYGTIYNGAGTPVSNAPISLIRSRGFLEDAQYAIRSKEDGSYRFEAIPEGEYALIFSSDPQKPYVMYTTSDGWEPVDVREGQNEYRIDLRAGVYEINGAVIDADTGNPIAEARVDITQSISDDPHAYLIAQPIFSDESGQFTLHPIQSGSYRLSVSKDDYTAYEKTIDIQPALQSKRSPITLDVRLKMEKTAVKIVLMESGAPWSGPTPTAEQWRNEYRRSLTVQAVDGQNGIFEIEGLMPGETEINIIDHSSAKRYQSFPQQILVQPGQTTLLAVQMHRIQEYLIVFEPNDGNQILGRVGVFADGYPTFERLPQFALLPNWMAAIVPIDSRKVRIAVPGYKPVEFNPTDSADPSNLYNNGSIEIVLKLERE